MMILRKKFILIFLSAILVAAGALAYQYIEKYDFNEIAQRTVEQLKERYQIQFMAAEPNLINRSLTFTGVQIKGANGAPLNAVFQSVAAGQLTLSDLKFDDNWQLVGAKVNANNAQIAMTQIPFLPSQWPAMNITLDYEQATTGWRISNLEATNALTNELVASFGGMHTTIVEDNDKKATQNVKIEQAVFTNNGRRLIPADAKFTLTRLKSGESSVVSGFVLEDNRTHSPIMTFKSATARETTNGNFINYEQSLDTLRFDNAALFFPDLANLGYESFTSNLSLLSKHDITTGQMETAFNFTSPAIADVRLNANVGNVPPSLLQNSSGNISQVANVGMAGLSLSVSDNGVLKKYIKQEAQKNNTTEEEIIQKASTLDDDLKNALAANTAQNLETALHNFFTHRNRLDITISPSPPVSLAQAMMTMLINPLAFTAQLNISAQGS